MLFEEAGEVVGIWDTHRGGNPFHFCKGVGADVFAALVYFVSIDIVGEMDAALLLELPA